MKIDRRTLLIAGGIVVLLAVGGGGAVVVKISADKRRNRELLRAAARRYGLNPDWLDAIAKHESNWSASARSPRSAADEKYGGAFGLTQMLWVNIQKMGFTGTQTQFLADPATQAEIAAKFAKDGPRTSFTDFAAWWNSGKRTLAAAPAVTRNDYVPKTITALNVVQSSGLAGYTPRVRLRLAA